MSLGEQIKKLRNKKKLTQNELADLMGLKPVTISKYESNDREPNIETLRKLSTVLGVPIIKLIDEKKLEETPLNGILSNTTENSSIEQQALAYLIDKRINNAGSKFEDLLSNFLSIDSVQQELNYKFDDLTGDNLIDLSQFMFYMLKLKMIEINSKNN